MSDVCMQIKDLSLEGNIIDNGWIENLKYDSGKTNMNAVMILSEIVYWYRPTLVKDEKTGKVLGYKKKFKADKLQKNYEDLGMRFGLTKRQAKEAVKFLANKKIITLEFRTITINSTKLNNVLFIEPIFENLKAITGVNRIISEDDDPMTLERNSLSHYNVTPCDVKKSHPLTFKRKTNTKTTKQRLQTEITNNNNKDENFSKSYVDNRTNLEKTVVAVKKDIEAIIKADMSTIATLDLLAEKGEDKIRFYLKHWNKFKVKKHNVVGFFLDMVKKEYKIPEESKTDNYKPPQSTNFEQREYDDDYFESLYTNSPYT